MTDEKKQHLLDKLYNEINENVELDEDDRSYSSDFSIGDGHYEYYFEYTVQYVVRKYDGSYDEPSDVDIDLAGFYGTITVFDDGAEVEVVEFDETFKIK